MKARIVSSARIVGTKVIINLACGHSITRTASTWQHTSVEHKEDCPQCSKVFTNRRRK